MQAGIESFDSLAGQVHGPEDVLEPRMFGGGENVPGGLELMDLSQALQPRVVD